MTEFSADSISTISSSGAVSTLLSGEPTLSQPVGITLAEDDNLYVSSFQTGKIFRVGKNGSISTFATLPSGSGSHLTTANGKLYVLSWSEHTVYEIPLSGDAPQATLIAGRPNVAGGADGSALEATFNRPNDIAVNQSGTILYVTDNNGVRQIDLDTSITDPITLNAGFNDAWFDPNTDGQGFFVTVFPDLGFVSAAWFTYDTELPDADASANLGDPGHRWLTALGSIDGNKSEMGISIATGGLFDTPTDITRFDDGSMTISFENCNSGTVEYDIPSINRQGTISIQRVANDNIALCEALSNPENQE